MQEMNTPLHLSIYPEKQKHGTVEERPGDLRLSYLHLARGEHRP
jgi:hypothetical protein